MAAHQSIHHLDEAIEEVDELLEALRNEREALDDDAKSAVRAVWRAIAQTRLHRIAISAGRTDRKTPSPEFAGLWSEASRAIAAVDPELSERLSSKAWFWTDPVAWQVDPKLDISLDSVTAAARGLLPYAARSTPRSRVPARGQPDVFVSHAEEDKEQVARPLVDGIEGHGYTAWFDEQTLRLGDSLRRSIDLGLTQSRFGAVVLSHRFFAKSWPRRELDGLVSLETQDGRKRILPIWHGVTEVDVARFSPTLADRVAVSTELGMGVVVSAIVDVLETER